MRLDVVLLPLVFAVLVSAFVVFGKGPGKAWAISDPFFQDLRAIHVAAQIESPEQAYLESFSQALARAGAASIDKGKASRLGVKAVAPENPDEGLHDHAVVTVLLQGQIVPCSAVFSHGGGNCEAELLLLTVRLFRPCPANDYRNVFLAPPVAVQLSAKEAKAGGTVSPQVQEALDRLLQRALGRPLRSFGPQE